MEYEMGRGTKKRRKKLRIKRKLRADKKRREKVNSKMKKMKTRGKRQ